MKYISFIIILTSCIGSASLAELQGPDLDNNGVRDDIDQYIDSLEDVTDEYRQALRDYAYYARESFKYDDNKKESIKNSYRMSWAYNCMALIGSEAIDHILPKIQEFNKVNRAARKKISVETKKINLLDSKTAKDEHHKKATKVLRAINNKYRAVNDEDKAISQKFRNIRNKMAKIVRNTRLRKNSFHKHDLHFHGKMVISAKDKSRVCGFRKRGYL